jgi:TonB-dependent starch-binding outer membrane protein SusC
MIKFYKTVRKCLTVLLVFGFAPIFAQQVVSGKVTSSDDGSALPGVNILEKGTTNGTVTDGDGSFKMSVGANAVLDFSFIGYVAQQVTVGNQTTINVVLQTDVTALQEVVVVGYGTSLKKDVTGSITKLSEDDFNQGPVVSALQKINGRAAGVTINQVGSEPGQAPNIRIRGITSLIGGNDPLVVVDGIQGGLDLLNQIPPTEIESFEILKDASATAIYGSRGAAGVVLVTTKKGNDKGNTTVEYNVVASVETIAKKYDMLSADQWRTEAQKRGIAASADAGGNTNWFDQVTRNGFTQTHNLAFGGGSKNFNYRASGTAILQDGIVINSNAKTYIGRIVASQKALNDKLTLTYNINTSIGTNSYNNADVIGLALGRRPTDPVYKTDGSYFTDVNVFNYTNPLARAKEIIDGDKKNSLFTTLRADYEIFDGLTASVFGSWRKTDRFYGRYESPKTTTPDGIQNNGVATRESNFTDERLLNVILSYSKIIGDHTIGASAIYEWQKQDYEGSKAIGRGFVNDFTSFNALQAGTLANVRAGDISSYRNDRTLVSFLGRVNYSFKDRYLATVTFRRDGSSVFGANNKYANFPAVSLAWRLSEEDFIKGLNVFNSLKLRVGYGVTGNQQGLGPLNSVRTVAPDGTVFFGGQSITNYSINQNANPDLKWETREMFNLGIDFTILQDKLSGTIDLYSGTTKDLLFDYQVPTPPYPFPSIKANVGTIINRGIELGLSYKLYNTSDWNVVLGGNFTSNINQVEELSGAINGVPLNTDFVQWGSGGTTGVASTNDGISYLIKGQSTGTFYLFKHAGVDEQGNQIIEDLNKNGKVDDGNRQNPDRYIAGQALPKFTFGFTPSVSYKNFDLNFVLRGAFGNKIYNVRRAQLSSLAQLGQANVLSSATSTNINTVNYASDFWLENGSYARLENLTLGYRVKLGAANKYIQSVRLSFTGNNLFVITDYTGIDPEVNQKGDSGFGIDYGIYPRIRSFALGLNVVFK